MMYLILQIPEVYCRLVFPMFSFHSVSTSLRNYCATTAQPIAVLDANALFLSKLLWSIASMMYLILQIPEVYCRLVFPMFSFHSVSTSLRNYCATTAQPIAVLDANALFLSKLLWSIASMMYLILQILEVYCRLVFPMFSFHSVSTSLRNYCATYRRT